MIAHYALMVRPDIGEEEVNRHGDITICVFVNTLTNLGSQFFEGPGVEPMNNLAGVINTLQYAEAITAAKR